MPIYNAYLYIPIFFFYAVASWYIYQTCTLYNVLTIILYLILIDTADKPLKKTNFIIQYLFHLKKRMHDA